MNTETEKNHGSFEISSYSESANILHEKDLHMKEDVYEQDNML